MRNFPKILLCVFLVGCLTHAFGNPLPSQISDDELYEQMLKLKLNLPNGMLRKITEIPNHERELHSELDKLLPHLRKYIKVADEPTLQDQIQKVLTVYAQRMRSKHDLQLELKQLSDRERNSRGEMVFANRKAQGDYANNSFKRRMAMEELRERIESLDGKDIAKFKETVKGGSPTQNFFELTKDIIDKDQAVQALEAQWDQSLLGIYTSQRLNTLLESEPFCRRASECSRSGGKIEQRSHLNGVMEENHK